MTRASTMSPEQVSLANHAWRDKLNQGEDGVKQAADAVNDYTRTEMKEGGIWRTLWPPTKLDYSELDIQVDTEYFVKIIERETETPGAQPIGFDMLPDNWYIHVDRYPVYFTRVTTAKAVKDVESLATTRMDVRSIISDKFVKDLLAAEDVMFIQSVNRALVGPNQVVPTSGVQQHVTFVDPLSIRDSWINSMQIMPSTPSSLTPHAGLINCISFWECTKMTRNEIGGNLAENMLTEGWAMESWMGLDWCVTLKKGLVPNNTVYQFADPDFIGKSFVLYEPTMFMERHRMNIEYSMMENIGAGIGWTSGLVRIDFDA